MKKIKELIQQLKSNPFEEKYPNYDLDDDKIHILYVAPCLNSSGYYRAIAPTIELNKTSTHSAIISNIHKWDFAKQFNDYDSPLDERLVRWAHYVVFPAIFTDIQYIAKILAEINDDLQFVMDLNQNFHELPQEHPDSDKITKEMKSQLLNNIADMDIVTCASEGLLDYYEGLLEEHLPSSAVFLEYLPSLISEYGYEEVKSLKKSEGEAIRIGLIGNACSAQDFLSILEVLKRTKERFQEKVEFVFFGWDGNLNGTNQLADLEFECIKSVSFSDYFDKLQELSLDLGLLPLRDIPYNTQGKSAIKLLELLVFGIPVVASDLEPYSLEIDPNHTGFVASHEERWIHYISRLIEDTELRHQVGKTALRSVWRTHGFTSNNLMVYEELFV